MVRFRYRITLDSLWSDFARSYQPRFQKPALSLWKMASKSDGNQKPVAEWGLDPVHWTHVKLFISDILSLPENQTIKGEHFFNSLQKKTTLFARLESLQNARGISPTSKLLARLYLCH